VIPLFEANAIEHFLNQLQTRNAQVSIEIQQSVREILENVRERGDEALIQYTKEFDKTDVATLGLRVKEEEMETAISTQNPKIMEIFQHAVVNIRRFHEKTKRTSWIEWQENGVVLGQQVSPIEKVGIYVPGGRAVYPSSLFMAVIPAQVAGVSRIVITSPPGPDGKVHPLILLASHALGIHEIYRIGGAQAIGALAFGTQTIPKVDKIVGPGNRYVAEAKRQVFGIVDIDMIAGPSEVVILADESASPHFVAGDLLAQAEHDPFASAICITPSSTLAKQIQEAIEVQFQKLKRKEILKQSLSSWGAIILVDCLENGIALVNWLAPEHLGLHTKNPWEILGAIRNAGAIFLGHYAPETVGDYWAGPNHILPTNTTARFFSPLSTEDFQKTSSIIYYTKSALEQHGSEIIQFAQLEELDAHANAIQVRIQ